MIIIIIPFGPAVLPAFMFFLSAFYSSMANGSSSIGRFCFTLSSLLSADISPPSKLLK